MMKGEEGAENANFHNIPIEIFSYRSMHMMMYFIAIIVATFTVVVIVVAASAGVLHIT